MVRANKWLPSQPRGESFLDGYAPWRYRPGSPAEAVLVGLALIVLVAGAWVVGAISGALAMLGPLIALLLGAVIFGGVGTLLIVQGFAWRRVRAEDSARMDQPLPGWWDRNPGRHKHPES